MRLAGATISNCFKGPAPVYTGFFGALVAYSSAFTGRAADLAMPGLRKTSMPLSNSALVLAGRPLLIDQIHELPGILSELELQLSLVVERDSIASFAYLRFPGIGSVVAPTENTRLIPPSTSNRSFTFCGSARLRRIARRE
jgi:hypothetical protein